MSELIVALERAEKAIAEQYGKLTEAATFLDALADRLLHDEPVDLADRAADCRAMAKRLRA
jgi:hypothetical protein